MQMIKRLFNFYINGSIHVGVAAFALVSMTMYFFAIQGNFEVKAFVFFGTIIGYNFVKFDALIRRNGSSIGKELQFIIGLTLCSSLVALYFFLQLRSITQTVVVVVVSLVLLYTLPFFPNKQNARNWKGIKIYIVSLSWVIVTVLLPLINAKIHFTEAVLLLCMQRFLLIFVLVLIFEIIDFNNDDPHLKTVPQQIGIERTKLLGNTLLIVFLSLEFLYLEKQEYFPLLLKCIVSCVIAIFLYFANETRSRYYASFWVESIPTFWWLLVVYLK